MKSGRLTLAGFISLLPLLAGASCVSKPGAPPPSAIADRAEATARADLARQHAPIPAALGQKKQGPVDLPSVPDMNEDLARAKWQTDRNRLRACVASDASLIEEVKLRGLFE